jgi:hypothetical protein
MLAHERRTVIRRCIIALALVGTAMTVARWPTTRFVGVDFVISQQTLPLWVKAVEFVDRDANLARTAGAVLSGVEGEEARAAAALAWTRANIRYAPPGLPVVDDHIWHIIVRGYGQSDQMADVFTTLLAYSGVRAYWAFVGERPGQIPMSYVWIRDRWRVFDVMRGIAFRNVAGELATPEEIAADHTLIRLAAAPIVDDIEGYLARFAGYQAAPAPAVLRAELQMPGRRLWYETRRLFGMRAEEPRP